MKTNEPEFWTHVFGEIIDERVRRRAAIREAATRLRGGALAFKDALFAATASAHEAGIRIKGASIAIKNCRFADDQKPDKSEGEDE